MSRPTLEDVQEAIRSLVRGRGATREAVLARGVALLELEYIVAAAGGRSAGRPPLHEVADTAILELKDATNELEENPERDVLPNRARAALIALGLAAGYYDMPLQGRHQVIGRRGAIADALGYSSASLTRSSTTGGIAPLDRLINDLAWAIWLRERDYRNREIAAEQRRRRAPGESALGINWLSRFEHHYLLWARLNGLGGDLSRAAKARRKGDVELAEYFTRKSLYYFATFLMVLDELFRQFGGLWLMPDPGAENVLADAMWEIRQVTPLTELDASHLRLALREDEELVPFLAHLDEEPLQTIALRWQRWIATCRCRSDTRPAKRCEIHQLIAHVDLYIETLDREWDHLSDWYGVPRIGSQVDYKAAIAQQTKP